MAVPGTPKNFYVQQGDTKTLSSWAVSSSSLSYDLQRSTDGISFTTISTTSQLSYLDTSVSIGGQYYYRVAAVNASGSSSYTIAGSAVLTLPGQMTLGQIRLAAQQRADMVNNNFVTLPEWNSYINQSYYELYDLLITTYEDYYVAPRLQFTTTSSSSYDLPNGQNYSSSPAFYKLFGVDLGLDGSNNAFSTLKKYNFIDRNRYVYPQITTTILGAFNLQYRVVGGKIMFIPIPSSGQTIGLWYFPRLTMLLQDTDVMDGISGWTEYVIVDTAIKAMRKEESDTQELMVEKMMLKKRIEETAVNRDAGQPDTISDTRTWGNRYVDSGSSGDGGPSGGF